MVLACRQEGVIKFDNMEWACSASEETALRDRTVSPLSFRLGLALQAWRVRV